MLPRSTILERWQLTPRELTEILDENPSLRGITLGYVAEYKARKIFESSRQVTGLRKPDDHDRTKKGDFIFTYKGREVSVEVKSLQTATVKPRKGGYAGKVPCDASDRRKVKLPNGREVETTCLLVGEFDLLAVNLFAFESVWRFIFARNESLPRSTFRRYPADVKEHLLATLIEVSWPVRPPPSCRAVRTVGSNCGGAPVNNDGSGT